MALCAAGDDATGGLGKISSRGLGRRGRGRLGSGCSGCMMPPLSASPAQRHAKEDRLLLREKRRRGRLACRASPQQHPEWKARSNHQHIATGGEAAERRLRARAKGVSRFEKVPPTKKKKAGGTVSLEAAGRARGFFLPPPAPRGVVGRVARLSRAARPALCAPRYLPPMEPGWNWRRKASFVLAESPSPGVG